MKKKHECFMCGFENNIKIECKSNSNVRAFTKKDDYIIVEPTFISEDKFEIEYYCQDCKNKNRVIYDV